MAESLTTEVESVIADSEHGDKKLQDIFLEGWNGYEDLETTELSFNSTEYQNKVKKAMEHLETATRIVSQFGVFSANEQIDEVSTESLQYLLLPFFLGKLTLKLNRDRLEVLTVAEVYFKDFLQRCQEYELYEPSKSVKNDKTAEQNGNNELAQLMRAAHTRNDKLAQYRKKKELEEQIKLMKDAIKSNKVEDEVRRDFFLKYINKSIIETIEEMESVKMEKQIVEMRKMKLPTEDEDLNSNASETNNARLLSKHESHTHRHGHHQHAPPKPKPLKPFIITRSDAQKAVFGLGYPSLPVMSVDDFYKQRVAEGIFPDEEKVAKMNKAQAVAAAKDPNEQEDEEKAVEELQVENDDPEYIARMRRMDEYKDMVRRGDGNRYNRS